MVQFSWPSEKAPAEIWCTTDCLTPYRHAKLWVSQFDGRSLLHASAVCFGLQHMYLRGTYCKPAEQLSTYTKHWSPAGWAPSGTSRILGEPNCLPLPLWLLEDTCSVMDKLRVCGHWGDGVESQRLGCCGTLGVSYRGMKSGTADLQPILGMLRSAISEDVLLQKCTTPRLGCKEGKEKREWSNRWGSDSS